MREGKDLGEEENPLSDGVLFLPEPLLLSPNFPTESRRLESEDLFRFLQWRDSVGKLLSIRSGGFGSVAGAEKQGMIFAFFAWLFSCFDGKRF